MDLTSFCIITDGKEPEKLAREVESIRALGGDTEIIVCGDDVIGYIPGLTKFVPFPQAAREGRLGAMRNRAIDLASGSVIVSADDDLYFHANFLKGLERMGAGWDVLSCRILNPDGTRFWDWKTHKGGVNKLLPYTMRDAHVSLTGGLVIARNSVYSLVEWPEELGFYQEEDVEFTQRLKRAGMRIGFCPYATVTHDDAGYSQRGEYVVRC